MAIFKQGISTFTPKVNDKNPINNLLAQKIDNLTYKIIPARVIDIVLDDNHPKFNLVGQWNGIGAIYYEFVNKTDTSSTSNDSFALPYDAQLKTYPLVNEVILLLSLPSQNLGSYSSAEQYFYLKPLNIWNHPHHDAYPNLPITNNNQLNDYQASGSIRRVEDGSTDINLNSPINPSQNTFVEKADIKPLMPFMGDSLMEGRYGQSIRFGSTAKSQSKKKNNWSESGDNGDPILIIRNGQPEKLTDDRGWIPITEDLNKDLSSIYLTSKQKIPFSIANENFLSLSYSDGTSPTTPSLYINPQIILNSDRIVLNAKKDSVLISGQKSVGLSSNDSVNIGAKQIYIDGSDIRLGSKNAEEPVLLGNQTTQLLEIIIKELINLSEKLQSPALSKIDPTLLPVASAASINLNKTLAQLDSIKSNFVKTS